MFWAESSKNESYPNGYDPRQLCVTFLCHLDVMKRTQIAFEAGWNAHKLNKIKKTVCFFTTDRKNKWIG